MTHTVITSIDQVTPELLTAVLSRDGALVRGQVAAFDVNAGGGNWSSNALLRLRYSEDAQGALPERLFLKMVDTDLGDGEYFGSSEVDYYTRDYLGAPDAPLIRCYHGAYSPELQRYHLLLDDLSETHIPATDRIPTLEYGLALAEAFAALHAHWWGAKRLAEIGAPIHEAAHIQRFVDIARPGVEHILGRFTADLEPHWPGLIHDLYARHPQAMNARTQDDNGFTLIHGDAGCTNILAPKQGERPIYLIDRQPFDWSLTTWLGAYDLAYAMVLDWDTPLRRSLEIPVLRRYHEALQQRGVTGYSWQRLWDDYRLCAAMGVYIATEYCRGGVNERYTWVWLPMLQRSLAAFDELDCQSLW